MAAPRKRLGEMLMEAGALDAAGVQAVLAQQKQRAARFGQIAVDAGLITEEVLVRALAAQLGVSAAQLDQMRIPGVVMQLMAKDVAMRWHVFPLGMQKENNVEFVYVATADPTNVDTFNALQAKLGRRVRLVLAGERAIARAIQEYYFEGPVAFGTPGVSYIPGGAQPAAAPARPPPQATPLPTGRMPSVPPRAMPATPVPQNSAPRMAQVPPTRPPVAQGIPVGNAPVPGHSGRAAALFGEGGLPASAPVPSNSGRAAALFGEQPLQASSPVPSNSGRAAALFGDGQGTGSGLADATRRFVAPPELLGQSNRAAQVGTPMMDVPPTPAPDDLVGELVLGTVEGLEPESDEIQMDDGDGDGVDMEATTVGPAPTDPSLELDMMEVDDPTPNPAATVNGSVYTSMPSDGMLLQVKAMIRQRLVDDELVWVFIDKGLVSETEVTWLRGDPLPPRRGKG